MPATGPKPKAPEEKRTRHPLTNEWVDVVAVPYEGEKPSIGRVPARTQRWWDVISRMPHCVLWDETDWQFAVDTAHLHAAWVRKGAVALASEVRQREKLMGTTWDFRRDLRIRYVEATVTEAGGPTALDEYRRELAK